MNMNSDIIIVYGCLLLVITLIFFIRKYSKLFLFFNTIIFILYTSYFLYQLKYDIGGGVALVWLFYLFCLSIIHSIILIIYLIVKRYRSKH